MEGVVIWTTIACLQALNLAILAYLGHKNSQVTQTLHMVERAQSKLEGSQQPAAELLQRMEALELRQANLHDEARKYLTKGKVAAHRAEKLQSEQQQQPESDDEEQLFLPQPENDSQPAQRPLSRRELRQLRRLNSA